MESRLYDEIPSAIMHLKYLPPFAKFLLASKHEDFSAEVAHHFHLDDSRFHLNGRFSTAQISEMLLHALSENDTERIIRETAAFNIRHEVGNNGNFSDVLSFLNLSKLAVMHFIPQYTADSSVAAGIATELDQVFLHLTRRIINQEVCKMQELTERMQSLASLGMWQWDIKNERLFWSDQLFRIYNIPVQSSVTFSSFVNFCHPEDKAIVRGEMFSASESNTMLDLFFRIVTAEGHEKVVHIKGKTTNTDHNGHAVTMEGTLQDVTEQKAAHINLAENRNLIRRIADVTPSLISVYNVIEKKYVFINQSLTTLLGYQVQQMLDGGIGFLRSHVHPQDIKSLSEKIILWLKDADSGKVKDGEPVIQFMCRIKNINNEYRHFNTNATVFSRDALHNVESVIAVSIDVTEQQQLKREIADERSFADLLIENSPDMIVAFNNEKRITLWNRKAEELTGLKRERAIGRHSSEVFPENNSEQWHSAVEKVLAGEIIHYPKIHLDKNRFGENFMLPFRNAADKIVGILSITRDITKLVESAAQIEMQNEIVRRSEEKYHNMVEEVVDYAIILLDPEGRVENWNKGAEKIKGYKAEEIIGKNFRLFYSKEDQKNKRPERLKQKALQFGRATDEGWRIRKDGSRFWGYTVITALHNTAGEVLGYTKVTRDLTHIKMVEDQLRRHAVSIEQKNIELEKSNKELESFSYVASHDLQEPLRKIQAFSNRILEKENENLSESGKDMFHRVQSAANRMQELIDALLNFSRANTAPRVYEMTDMNILLQDVCSNLKESIDEKHAAIHIDTMPLLRIIPFQVHQLFNNLISNSLKYSRKDVPPEIRITFDVKDGEDIKDEAAKKGLKYYAISVKDNGIGFEQKYADRVFELFQRLHGRNEYSGTGIGLSICKKIAENHHGFMRATSAPGQGATFTLYIPVEGKK